MAALSGTSASRWSSKASAVWMKPVRTAEQRKGQSLRKTDLLRLAAEAAGLLTVAVHVFVRVLTSKGFE